MEGCNHTILDQVDGQVRLKLLIGHHSETITLWTMNLSDDMDILLGYDWLQCHNPQIDWEQGTFALEKCPNLCLNQWDKKLDKEDKLYSMDVKDT